MGSVFPRRENSGRRLEFSCGRRDTLNARHTMFGSTVACARLIFQRRWCAPDSRVIGRGPVAAGNSSWRPTALGTPRRARLGTPTQSAQRAQHRPHLETVALPGQFGSGRGLLSHSAVDIGAVDLGDVERLERGRGVTGRILAPSLTPCGDRFRSVRGSPIVQGTRLTRHRWRRGLYARCVWAFERRCSRRARTRRLLRSAGVEYLSLD